MPWLTPAPAQSGAARRFALLVAAAALPLAVAAALCTSWTLEGPRLAEVATLAVGVVLGEFFPFTIPRRGEDEQITISTSFSFALLLIGGLVPAIAAQGVASAAQDLAAGKPRWRVAFNVGQYTLALGGAFATLTLAGATVDRAGPVPFPPSALPAVALAAAVFFALNNALVGTTIALYRGTPVVQYIRNDLRFSALMGAVLLCLAPILVATVVYSPLLAPLFVLPMITTYVAGRQASRMDWAARHDGLTGLADRGAFQDAVDRALQGDGTPCAVLLMDLDRFKDVNDSLGHHHGDLLLRGVAERLRAAVPIADPIARLGGDEFALRVPCDDPDAVDGAAEAIRAALEEPFDLDGYVADVEASIGIALFPQDAGSSELLLQRADVAMYHAKRQGRPSARYDERHDHHSAARLALVADLRRAVDTDEIVLWYQPKIDIAARTVTGVEALVRWEHPQLGLLMPAAFLDVAEQTSLITPLTRNVLRQALEQCGRWLDAGLELQVAVNVSARSLLERGFAGEVMTALTATGVPPGLLRLEITESLVMSDPETATDVLAELSRHGVRIAVDDFGTGYSSLSYLHRLPVDEVKIDRSFVLPMAGAPDGETSGIVSSIVQLGHHLGLCVVAEGVEDEGTLTALLALGCDAAQGYHIGRPLPPAALEQWLRHTPFAPPVARRRRLRAAA